MADASGDEFVADVHVGGFAPAGEVGEVGGHGCGEG